MEKVYKPLYLEEFTEITIKWTKPILRARSLKTDYKKQRNSYFYKILTKSNRPNSKYKLVYIGKTYSQFVSDRLTNKDHIIKANRIKEQHRKSNIYISVGNVVGYNGRITKNLIDRIERLLIFSTSNKDFQLTNSKSTKRHNLTDGLLIINKGYRTELYKEMIIGVFYRN